jgi:hypothetical protein
MIYTGSVFSFLRSGEIDEPTNSYLNMARHQYDTPGSGADRFDAAAR